MDTSPWRIDVGSTKSHIVEQDAVAPLNAYGRSKLAGERGVRVANPRHVILRTAFRRDFVITIPRLGARRVCWSLQRNCSTLGTAIPAPAPHGSRPHAQAAD